MRYSCRVPTSAKDMSDLDPERFTLRQAAQARNQPGTTHAKGALRATQAAHREQHVIRWADVF